MPLYKVTSGEGEVKVERLVEANNKATARNFAARSHFTVEVAEPTELFRLAKAGAEIEVAVGGDAEIPGDATGAALSPAEVADSVASGAIEGAGAALDAGGDARDVAAAAIGGAAAATAEVEDKVAKAKK